MNIRIIIGMALPLNLPTVRPTGESPSGIGCDRGRPAAHIHSLPKCARRSRADSPSPLSPVCSLVDLCISHLVDDSGQACDRATHDRTWFLCRRHRGLICAAPIPTRAPFDGYRLGSHFNGAQIMSREIRERSGLREPLARPLVPDGDDSTKHDGLKGSHATV